MSSVDRWRDLWPMMTWADTGDLPRTVVVVHSISMPLPPAWQPLLPAYEERFLCYLLTLASQGSRVVYVTSVPVLPRLVDYWLGLVPGLDTPETRSRLLMLPVVDARPVPLTRKVLDHPGIVDRIRDAITDPRRALLIGHSVTDDELALADLLGIPAYGPPPSASRWGTKSGSREAFGRAGLAVAPGGFVRTRADVVAVVERLRAEQPGLAQVVVKHDEGVSGLGNGRLDLRGVERVETCLDTIELEAEDASPADFYARLEREGGVVEVFLDGDRVTSPSAQVRVPPGGPSEVLSTHEQVVGGRHGLQYEGCVMPASGRYAALLAEHASRVGAVLAEEGVVGRFAIDFLVVDDEPEPEVFGLEINLRNGGTTHPLNTLAALCGGAYDPVAGHYVTSTGAVRGYRATDHLVEERYSALTTDELLDLVAAEGLAWDHAAQTGVLLHMASGIAGMGVVGLTAIAPTTDEAVASYERVRVALDRVAAARRRPLIGIVPFETHHRADFERLNREWVERWFTLEPVDLEVLSDPERHLIAGGGQVLLAVTADGTTVGTAALRHEGDGVYELTKMSVTPDLRGAGIGRMLAEAAITAYVATGGSELYLETNSRLGPAIALYESLGFEHRPLRPGSHYDRADVHMVWVPPVA